MPQDDLPRTLSQYWVALSQFEPPEDRVVLWHDGKTCVLGRKGEIPTPEGGAALYWMPLPDAPTPSTGNTPPGSRPRGRGVQVQASREQLLAWLRS
ncbi:MAG: hypothetical protein H7831_13100 [Magnetococcus sp. WYHC-3]